MKIFLLALFVAVSTANPIPDDGGAVDVIVNGVPEGEPLEISDIIEIKVKEHVGGVLTSATNVLHPYSAAGIAEAAEADVPVVVVPEPVELPVPAEPEVVSPEVIIPEPIILPQPVLPEVVVPEPVIVVPEPVILPEPVQPEVVPEVAEELPVPAPQIPQGEVYNDGIVQVSVNTPQDEGMIGTLQSWLSVVLNYFNNGAQTTQQIV